MKNKKLLIGFSVVISLAMHSIRAIKFIDSICILFLAMGGSARLVA